MKKVFTTLSLILAVLTLVCMISACADGNSAAMDVPAASEAAQTPATPEVPVDPLVGAWKMPPSPFGDDFTCYVVLNADGSFMNVTNLYESGSSGPYTQTVSTNETFFWKRTGPTSLELHYSYLDENGEFVTELTYNEGTDTLYYWGQVYAERDTTFVLDQ